jgi:hypothetical protein
MKALSERPTGSPASYHPGLPRSDYPEPTDKAEVQIVRTPSDPPDTVNDGS